MTLLLCCLVLSHQYVVVDLDFVLSFLHTHFELVFPILESEHLIHCRINDILNLLDLELHDIMLHEHLLLRLHNLVEVLVRHIILEGEFINELGEPHLLPRNQGELSLYATHIIVELLYTLQQGLVLLLHL